MYSLHLSLFVTDFGYFPSFFTMLTLFLNGPWVEWFSSIKIKEKRYGVYANELIKTEVTIQTGPNILELSF